MPEEFQEERRAEYWGRREHDHDCDKNQASMKEWVRDKMCILKKDILGVTAPTRARVALVLTIMLLMLSASLTSAYKSISAAENATEIHATNTAAIKHNKEEIEEVKLDHSHLVTTVEEIQRTQSRMDRNLSRLLGEMGVKAETK